MAVSNDEMKKKLEEIYAQGSSNIQASNDALQNFLNQAESQSTGRLEQIAAAQGAPSEALSTITALPATQAAMARQFGQSRLAAGQQGLEQTRAANVSGLSGQLESIDRLSDVSRQSQQADMSRLEAEHRFALEQMRQQAAGGGGGGRSGGRRSGGGGGGDSADALSQWRAGALAEAIDSGVYSAEDVFAAYPDEAPFIQGMLSKSRFAGQQDQQALSDSAWQDYVNQRQQGNPGTKALMNYIRDRYGADAGSTVSKLAGSLFPAPKKNDALSRAASTKNKGFFGEGTIRDVGRTAVDFVRQGLTGKQIQRQDGQSYRRVTDSKGRVHLVPLS